MNFIEVSAGLSIIEEYLSIANINKDSFNSQRRIDSLYSSIYYNQSIQLAIAF
jgi:hypothetical protein